MGCRRCRVRPSWLLWPSLYSYYYRRHNRKEYPYLRFLKRFLQFSVSHYLPAAESFLFILKFISNHGIMGIYCKWKRIDGVDFHIAETLNLKNKLESHLFIRLWKDFIKSKAEMKRDFSQWCRILCEVTFIYCNTKTFIAFYQWVKMKCIIFHVIFLGCEKLPSASKACNFVLFCHFFIKTSKISLE